MRTGAAVRAMRIAHSKSLSDTSTASGVQKGWLWAIETGSREATPETLNRISRALGVPLWKIYFLTNLEVAVEPLDEEAKVLELYPELKLAFEYAGKNYARITEVQKELA